jgi:Flp pilus assembly protein TadD
MLVPITTTSPWGLAIVGGGNSNQPELASDGPGREGQRRSDDSFLKSAVEQLARGELDAALVAASNACHSAPDDPRAHYVYGQAWLALNQPKSAEQAFAAAIKLSPRFADAWINYGVARYRQGAMEDAKTAMRQVLAFAPGHAAAASNLAAFLRITGGLNVAETLLRDQLAANPNDIGARLNLAADFLQEERPAEALALLVEIDPPHDNPRAVRHWHLQKSLALLQMRRVAEAKTVLDALAALGPIPPEIAPLWHWRHVLIALGENNVPGAIEAAERMEAALNAMGAEAVLEHRIMAHYDLAKFFSGSNAHARAFAHWTAGHKLLALTQPFSRDAHRAFVDASIAAFSAERFRAGPRATNNDLAPIFIVGMPRSGTTLIEQILDAHRDAHGAGERGALAQAFFALGGGDDARAVQRIAGLDSSALDAAAESYLAALHALAPEAKRVVDKMPGNFHYLGLVGLMLPGAKIIYCARDPRDIGLSIFTFRFHGSHAYAHDLGDLGWYIGQHERLMMHWKAALPHSILTVRLADWIEDFDGTLAKVLDHVGLAHDPNCTRFYENDSRVRTVSRAQVRQPINSRGLGRWRQYADELAPLISELERAGSLARWDSEQATTGGQPT